MLEAISLAAGLSWGSGLRLYLTVFLVGVFERIDIVHLPFALHFLGSPYVIAVAGGLTVIEFLADKIPALDSLWDAVHTFIRLPAGAALAAVSLGPSDAGMSIMLVMAGGTLAAIAHLAKSATRAAINLSGASPNNVVVSLAEDALVVGGLTLAVLSPLVFLAILLAFVAAIGWALPRLWRGIRGGWRGMSADMVPSVQPMTIKHD
ncbi:MAG: DUF4126 domain-containing protein [Janthinobacterium lividum]